MELDYKGQIVHLLSQIDDEKFLRYLYILVKEMVAKKLGE